MCAVSRVICESTDVEGKCPALVLAQRAEARHRRTLDTQGNSTIQAIDTALIQALAIMEVARCRVETGTCWPIALALQTMTGSALGLVKFRREREVGKPLRSNLNIVGVDDIPAELMGQCGHLRA